MPICTQCGHSNTDEARFCSNCGAALQPAGPAASPASASETSTITIGGGFEPGEPREKAEGLSGADQAADRRAAAGSALLVVRRGPNSGSRFLLDSEATTAGRHPASDIFLDDVTVSRRHAEFVRTGEGFASATSGPSTAPTSTASASTSRPWPAATRSRSASTGSSSTRASTRRDEPAAMSAAPSSRSLDEHRGGARRSCAPSSPTSPSPRSATWRPRAWWSRPARRRATASSARPTSRGCATSWPRSATTTCRCGSSGSTSTRSTAGSSRRRVPGERPAGARAAGRRTGCRVLVRSAETTELRLSRAELVEAAGLEADAARPDRGLRPARARPGRGRRRHYDATRWPSRPRWPSCAATASSRGTCGRSGPRPTARSDLVEQVVTPLLRQRSPRPGPGPRRPPGRSARCRCGCTRPWSRPGCATSSAASSAARIGRRPPCAVDRRG